MSCDHVCRSEGYIARKSKGLRRGRQPEEGGGFLQCADLPGHRGQRSLRVNRPAITKQRRDAPADGAMDLGGKRKLVGVNVDRESLHEKRVDRLGLTVLCLGTSRPSPLARLRPEDQKATNERAKQPRDRKQSIVEIHAATVVIPTDSSSRRCAWLAQLRPCNAAWSDGTSAGGFASEPDG